MKGKHSHFLVKTVLFGKVIATFGKISNKEREGRRVSSLVLLALGDSGEIAAQLSFGVIV